MNNKQIAAKFDLLAKLMELHDDNPFKIKSYANAYLSLRKLEGSLTDMSKDELSGIPGVGNAIADKICELLSTGEMKTLKTFQDKTPAGIQEMLTIKGLGAKKVKQIWKEMEITSTGELLYACNENRLVGFKGFGIKIQDEIKQRIEYFMDAQGKFLYAHVHKAAEELESILRKEYTGYQISICGDVRRMMPEVCGIELITDMDKNQLSAENIILPEDEGKHTYKGFPVFIYHVSADSFIKELFRRSCSIDFLQAFDLDGHAVVNESQLFTNKGIHFIPSECREDPEILD